MPVNSKVVGISVLAASTAFLALRQQGGKVDVVESTNSGPIEDFTNVDTSGPYPVVQTEIESSNNWEPNPAQYTPETGEENKGWDWAEFKEEEKKAKREEAAKIYGTLNDLTFKFFMPCGQATGWILDYEIPNNEQEYPTKFYIATNAHVIWRLNFEDNTYKQNLPRDASWTQELRKRHQNEYEQAKSYSGNVRDKCEAVDKFGYLDLNISQQKTGAKRKADVGGVAQRQMHEPKLFYSAFKFLEKWEDAGERNHFADFSVLEVEFTDEETARLATNNFADRYNVENGVAPIKFGKSIEKKYATKDELWKAKDNYYLLAYPVDGKDKRSHSKKIEMKELQ